MRACRRACRRACVCVARLGGGHTLTPPCPCAPPHSYQVPPLVSGKLTVVISPLVSLMKDQVRTRAHARTLECAHPKPC